MLVNPFFVSFSPPPTSCYALSPSYKSCVRRRRGKVAHGNRESRRYAGIYSITPFSDQKYILSHLYSLNEIASLTKVALALKHLIILVLKICCQNNPRSHLWRSVTWIIFQTFLTTFFLFCHYINETPSLNLERKIIWIWHYITVKMPFFNFLTLKRFVCSQF